MRHGVRESFERSLMRVPLYGYQYTLLHSRVGSQEPLIFLISRSASDKSNFTLLEPREPLKHSNTDLRSAKDTFSRIHDKVVAYFSPFFVATSSASLLWYSLRSTAIPPVVLKTNGVDVACFTSYTRLAYWRFLSVSCCLNIWPESMPL